MKTATVNGYDQCVDLLLGSRPLADRFDDALQQRVLSFFRSAVQEIRQEIPRAERRRETGPLVRCQRIVPGKYNGVSEEALVLRVDYSSLRTLFCVVRRMRQAFEQDSIGVAFRECNQMLRITPGALLLSEDASACQDQGLESVVEIVPDGIRIGWPAEPEIVRRGGSVVQPYHPAVEWDETYHINLHLIRQEHVAWCREQGIAANYYMDIDGGGINFYTMEFPTSREAREFAIQFGMKGVRPWPHNREKKGMGWIEYKPKFNT